MTSEQQEQPRSAETPAARRRRSEFSEAEARAWARAKVAVDRKLNRATEQWILDLADRSAS